MKNLIFVLIVFVLVFGIAYLFSRLTQKNQPRQPAKAALLTVGQRTKEDDCVVNGPFQDKACTPGAIFSDVTAEQICVRGYARSVRNVPVQVKHEVYREYGITHHRPGEYEVDHLISLELGGSNDIANLWPEAAEPRPGFHERDKVENYLHEEICAGRIPLAQAQAKIANDWLEVYKQMGN